MRTAAVRQELLTSNDKDLNKRRRIMQLSAVGIADFAFVSLYQAGAINRLPELPFDVFDSNKVNAAPDAYKMGAPDAAISTLLYAAGMVLATWGGTAASGRKPVHDVALGAVIAGNAGGAVYYISKMIFRQERACPYCIVGAAINIVSAVIIAPTVAKAFKKLFEK